MKPKQLKNDKLKSYEYEILVDGKKEKCIIQEPSFEALSLAMSAMLTQSGSINMIGCGKIIFDTCCIECSEIIENTPKLLVKLCLEFAADFVTPVDSEIKKNWNQPNLKGQKK